MTLIAPVLLGFAFGWVLHKGGLTRYERIVGVFLLRDATVPAFMLGALGVGAVLVQIGLAVGLAAVVPIPPFLPVANLVGGLIFGIGMATAGYCPGTIVASLGEGRLDALAGIAGLLTGGLVFAAMKSAILSPLGAVNLGRVALPSLIGADPWLVAGVFAELCVVVVYLVGPGRRAEP